MKQIFQTIPPEETDPVFRRIGKEWMLISASDGVRDNLMTASWGMYGILWGEPVAAIFVRPQRYTYELLEKAETLSLSFLPPDRRDALNYCGSHTGRKMEKFSAAGLTLTKNGDGIPYPAEAEQVLFCRKLYAQDLKKENFLVPEPLKHYAADDFHRMYICRIESVIMQKTEKNS